MPPHIRPLGPATVWLREYGPTLKTDIGAALTVAFCGLLRAAVFALGPGGRFAPAESLTRADISFRSRGGRRYVVLMMRPCKNDKVEQGKTVPLLLPSGGRFLDPVLALERMLALDPVPESQAARTPLFRSRNAPLITTSSRMLLVSRRLYPISTRSSQQHQSILTLAF